MNMNHDTFNFRNDINEEYKYSRTTDKGKNKIKNADIIEKF